MTWVLFKNKICFFLIERTFIVYATVQCINAFHNQILFRLNFVWAISNVSKMSTNCNFSARPFEQSSEKRIECINITGCQNFMHNRVASYQFRYRKDTLYVSPVVFDIVYKQNLFLVYLNLVKPCKTLGYRVNDFSCLHFF